MEKLDAALAEITTKVVALAEKHGPDAVLLAGKVFQMVAARSLMYGLAATTVALLGAGGLYYCCKNNEEFDGDGAVGFGLASFVFLCVGTFFAIVNLWDPLVWAAWNDPVFAIAAKALGKL